MAFLQAFTDDSESPGDDRRLFFAGYLNRAAAWALFADAWDEELRAAPAIRYLKTNEAYRLEGQFGGWTEAARDEKLRGLARVARHFKPVSFDFSVSAAEFRGALKGIAPRGLADPRFVCALAVVFGLANVCAQNKVAGPIEFFFDSQDGVSSDMALFFDHMLKDLPAESRRLVSGNPVFKSDLDFTPLQAADMLAWHLRADHDAPGKHKEMLGRLIGELHCRSEVPSELINKWRAGMSTLPTGKMQTKAEWRRLKDEVARGKAAGYRPPHGTRLRNLIFGIRDALRRPR